MKQNFLRLMFIGLIAALAVSACAPAAPAEPAQVEVTRLATVVEEKVVTATPEPETPVEPFRIAIVFPSSINDLAFSQAMYQALLDVQAEMGKDKLEIVYTENMPKVPDAAAALRDYASEGYDLVIAHGAVIGTALPQIAPDFPEVSFAWGSSADTFQSLGVENVFAYNVLAQQGGYVLGTMGALLTKSNVIGVTGPIETGDAKLYVDGFKAGALAAKPDVQVNVSYTGSFSDVSLMAAAAETHVQAGADILTGTSQSAVGTIGVAKEKGVYYLCQQWDQISLAPDSVVACQIYNFVDVVKDIIETHNAGVAGGKVYTLSFKNGGLELIYNDKVELPADVKKSVEAAIKGIEDGTIKP